MLEPTNQKPLPSPTPLLEELNRRLSIWQEIKQLGDTDVDPAWIRIQRIYGGAQGIWVDKSTTGGISSDGSGVTVGFLHTGRHYADELSDDDLVYHYPATGRPPGRDMSEIQATKNAGMLDLPIFVILPGKRSKGRRIRLGWVADHDDNTSTFLITFGDQASYVGPANPGLAFTLFDHGSKKKTVATARPNQQKFRFQVLKQYGPKCAICDVTEQRLLKAAHVCGKADGGCDDWRNGLPLCGTHHDAFDAHLIAVQPDTLKLHLAPGLDGKAIGVRSTELRCLSGAPHSDALTWRWADTQARWNHI